ncbi:MAG: NAD(P)/FAD-dependent oxidoreductase [Candidatus Altiarchaeota archaeon]
MSVAVLGGGLTGLVSAYLLSKKGFSVEVFERDGFLGGIAAPFPFEGTHLDRFYRHIYVCDCALLSLIDELGLGAKLGWHKSRMGFYSGGACYDFGGPLDLLRFHPLSFAERFRFGLITLYLGFVKDSTRFDTVSADEWLTKYMGKHGYETVWAHLLKSKFGDDYKSVPLSWFWSKIQLRKSNRTKTMSNEKLGYLDGSFKVLVDALADAIIGSGSVIHTGAPVEKLIVEGGRAVGLMVSGREFRFDRILSTLALPELAKLIPDSELDYRDSLLRIGHKGIVVMVLKLKRGLSPYYWLSIGDSTIPFNLLLEHTNLVSLDKYNGKHILYVSNYTSTDDSLYKLEGEELLEEYLPHLRKVYHGFKREDVEEVFVYRSDYGTPVFMKGYRNLIPSHKSPLENLYLACGEQIYPEDRGMSKSIEVAGKVVDLMV